jgi:hypothetical protein
MPRDALGDAKALSLRTEGGLLGTRSANVQAHVEAVPLRAPVLR